MTSEPIRVNTKLLKRLDEKYNKKTKNEFFGVGFTKQQLVEIGIRQSLDPFSSIEIKKKRNGLKIKNA